mgnify:CR=1 FL=1
MNINAEQLEFASSVLRALNHPLRKKIIEFIADQGETNVNNIYNTLKIEQSVTSQHLKTLRDAELVTSRRVGKKIFYSINMDNFSRYQDAIDQFS